MFKTADGQPAGLVYNIQKYTIHDGPGIRTEVFFKGCPLRCRWCSNPESLVTHPQIGVYPSKCLTEEKCGLCLAACPLGKETPILMENGLLKQVRQGDACDGCMKCVDICPSRAIMRWGDLKTVDELLQVVLEDRSFYQRTGGGVTLNGGEIMLQWEFAALLLKACKEASINTCIESSLHCPREHMEAVYRYTDLVITDIKHMDTKEHKKYTGVGNELILNNIRRTVELGMPLVIRTPIVPDCNNSVENIRATGAYIRDELKNRIVQYQLLPYRKMGTEKYATLLMPYPMGDDYVPPERSVWEQNLLDLTRILNEEFGVPAVPGSSHKLF